MINGWTTIHIQSKFFYQIRFEFWEMESGKRCALVVGEWMAGPMKAVAASSSGWRMCTLEVLKPVSQFCERWGERGTSTLTPAGPSMGPSGPALLLGTDMALHGVLATR